MSCLMEQPKCDAAEPTFKRYATRYEPTRRDACLTWWESGQERVIVEDELATRRDREARSQFALLLDISHTGASIALDRIPRPEAGVWIRLEGECETGWTEAEVVGVTSTLRGPHLIRLAFRAPCPFETLLAAVCG